MARNPSCTCGVCAKCKHNAANRAWYARNAAKGREVALASRERNLDRVRSYDRERAPVRDRAVDPLKKAARNAVRRLRRLGQGQVCDRASEGQCQGVIEAHHDDYSRPLEVRWLCKKHHAELSRKVAA